LMTYVTLNGPVKAPPAKAPARQIDDVSAKPARRTHGQGESGRLAERAWRRTQ